MLTVDCTRSIVNIDGAVLQHPKGRGHSFKKSTCPFVFPVIPIPEEVEKELAHIDI